MSTSRVSDCHNVAVCVPPANRCNGLEQNTKRKTQVHPNGRINYKGKETLADGADPLAETAARAASLVDRAALKAEVSELCRVNTEVGDRVAWIICRYII